MFEDSLLIYSFGRCGGTALQYIIYYLVEKYDEKYFQPFSSIDFVEIANDEKYVKDCFFEFVEKELDLNEENDVLVKHNVNDLRRTNPVHRRTFPNRLLEKYLLHEFDKVILNWRKKFLKCLVSSFIAIKTQVWQGYQNHIDNDYIDGVESFRIDIDNLRQRIVKKKTALENVKSYLDAKNISYVEAPYEEIFIDGGYEERLKQVESLLDNLGLNYEESKDNVKMFLSPENKLNSKGTYRVVENIDEINEKLGPKFGYLF